MDSKAAAKLGTRPELAVSNRAGKVRRFRSSVYPPSQFAPSYL